MICRPGITLVELLITVAIIGMLAAVLIPAANPVPGDALVGVARVINGDLAFARDLAVTNNSSYRLTFEISANRYILRHSGADGSLNTLPASPFASTSDTATQRVVPLSELPHIGASVRLAAVEVNGASIGTTALLEFGPLGETTQTADTTIWLASGRGAAERFLSVRVDAVTGMGWIGDVQAVRPGVLAAANASSDAVALAVGCVERSPLLRFSTCMARDDAPLRGAIVGVEQWRVRAGLNVRKLQTLGRLDAPYMDDNADQHSVLTPSPWPLAPYLHG